MYPLRDDNKAKRGFLVVTVLRLDIPLSPYTVKLHNMYGTFPYNYILKLIY